MFGLAVLLQILSQRPFGDNTHSLRYTSQTGMFTGCGAKTGVSSGRIEEHPLAGCQAMSPEFGKLESSGSSEDDNSLAADVSEVKGSRAATPRHFCTRYIPLHTVESTDRQFCHVWALGHQQRKCHANRRTVAREVRKLRIQWHPCGLVLSTRRQDRLPTDQIHGSSKVANAVASRRATPRSRGHTPATARFGAGRRRIMASRSLSNTGDEAPSGPATVSWAIRDQSGFVTTRAWPLCGCISRTAWRQRNCRRRPCGKSCRRKPAARSGRSARFFPPPGTTAREWPEAPDICVHR